MMWTLCVCYVEVMWMMWTSMLCGADVDLMCMLCGADDVDDVDLMCISCGGDVDDVDPQCGVSTCPQLHIGQIPVI